MQNRSDSTSPTKQQKRSVTDLASLLGHYFLHSTLPDGFQLWIISLNMQLGACQLAYD